jgi:hypothetical protein
MNNKKYFFGWGNIKKGITEIIKIYSSRSSFFSKKRMESGVAFIIAQWGMVFYLLKKYPDLTMTEMSMWAAIEFGISGYIIHQIQKEKKNDNNSDENKG